ncbi:putative TBP associated factor [Eremomyces bilateralis CBS 781.70]|uniref:TATA-binding protein-associated factor mot1 n=1 Tax=Eremomyces bilateralis CBS 781.70 TaxID=1392243 RepID=A0A6G1GEJ4_9PEZI|nr:putative TBP associated factor [Eremomyces bilateralis CBS 781.70]KAF1816473.1 putative TBP associated factor [Eremomyces bilateralis CBS 781.70]
MASRLDRLVTLLESGSTQLIRNTAAQQLADVQKQHPDELFNLLTRIIPYLRSKSWDTRIAAAKAIGGIVDNADKFDPNEDDPPAKKEENGASNGHVKKEESPERNGALTPNEDQLDLDSLDVIAILRKGKPLLSSAGKEYDYKMAAMDPADRLAHQKRSLTARLGLGGQYMEEELVSEIDFKLPTPRLDTNLSSISNVSVNSATATTPGDPQTPSDETGLSKRQLNMLKRKNKRDFKAQGNKVRIIDLNASGPRRGSVADPTPTSTHPFPIKTDSDASDEKTGHSDYFSLDRGQQRDDDSKLVKEFKGVPTEEHSALQPIADETTGLESEWPYDRLCELLTVDLFDPNWEVRHGAAMGLREVVRVQGGGAGRKRCHSRKQNDLLNKRWLDDLACRLCAVFMLDRFGDYVSDNVVVPVRETAGQCLGALLQYLPADEVKKVYRVLRRLVVAEDEHDARDGKESEWSERAWQPCHGGMLGMRYLVAVRADLLFQEPELLDGVLSTVMKGLGDGDDDVRAVSAATLIPVAKEIVQLRATALDELIQIVWDCLSNLSDDLSASTGSVMDLLAKLCSFPEVLAAMRQNAARDPTQAFAQLVPRLYPFLRHTITSVRSAVLRALMTFLEVDEGGDGEVGKGWINGKALRLVFQNLLVEKNEPVLRLSLQVWRKLLDTIVGDEEGRAYFAEEFRSHVEPLVTLTTTPVGVSRHPIPMNPSLFLRPSGQTYSLPANLDAGHKYPPGMPMEPPKKRRRSDKKSMERDTSVSSSHNVDGHMMSGDVDLVGVDVLVRSKIYSSTAMGLAMALWPSSSRADVFVPNILPRLNSLHSSTQLTASILIEEYSRALTTASTSFTEEDPLLPTLHTPLLHLVDSELSPHYADLTSYLHIVRAQCQNLTNTFRDNAHVPPAKLAIIPPVVKGDENAHAQFAFGIHDAEKIVGPDFDRLKKALTPAQRVGAAKLLDDARQDALKAIDEAKAVKEQRDVRIRSAAAAALVAASLLPKRPSLTIKALMDSVKREENGELQRRSAGAVARLVQQVGATGKRAIVEKVVGNLVKFACMETAETPEFLPNKGVGAGILSLRKEEDIRDHPDAARFEREAKAAKITRRGAKEALEQLVVMFGADLFDKLPVLRSLIEDPVRRAFGEVELPGEIFSDDSTFGQEVVDGLSTLRALVPKFDAANLAFVKALFPLLSRALQCNLAVLRYAAAKCFATICSVMTVDGITTLVEEVLPCLNNALDVHCRQGAIECVYHLIHVMEDGILPYVIFLIVPVLGRMSDSDNDVRLIATTTFAHLVKLVPLEAGIPDPPGLSEELLKGRERERKFMAQMLDAKKVEPFEIPVAIKAELRSYQQEGVNWLAFLNRYHLHGILCDDMGLGKTLQTLCIVASDHHLRAQEFEKTGSSDVRRLPSLIVCPPTLSGHWQQEIRTYAPFLTSVAYVGPPAERAKVRAQLKGVDIVITSYDICRNDSEILAPMNWNYCVLDEGHLIKNPRAKTTLAVKSLLSNHRLILSGTPIQNNVLELWSLFDFLMPGFLGTEKVFQDRFAKPIAASRFAKSSSKEQEAGALAIEALHKQVLPFLLRRLKEEVLNDLPPKILQNYYCDLSDLQRKLFEDFSKKESRALTESAGRADKDAKQHIFQALQYMRKLCNSPAFVMTEKHKAYAATQGYLAKHGTSLRDPVHAPKLTALRDLLVDCGIGASDAAPNGANHAANGANGDLLISGGDAVSQHRALIFCQMKEMLDMVQNEVLAKLLPSVTYMRLDGSVESSRRQDIVNKFNGDPSYDVLLLTTAVGGLGLNLTGADTVIFVEHDWNPQKDLQAMDRAHRIGQKKVVNVYRIVTRGTLEEKILNLQRFKIDVASTVVNQQNAGLATMETDQILDLFNVSSSSGDAAPALPGPENGDNGPPGITEEDAVDATGEVRKDGKRGYLDELGDLWDERQYEEEYDINSFLASMKG